MRAVWCAGEYKFKLSYQIKIRSVCSDVGALVVRSIRAFAARSKRMQRGQDVCSKVGVFVARMVNINAYCTSATRKVLEHC